MSPTDPATRRPRRLPAWAVALFAAVAVAAVWTAVRAARLPGHDEGVVDRPIEVETEGYVSSRTCGACHPQQYETWRHSYHRTMTQVVTPETVATELDGTKLSFDGTTWEFDRRGQHYWATVRTRLPGGGESVRERPVVMSTGSHSMQVYWMAADDDDRRLEMIPFHYLIGEKEWLPRQASFLIPPGRNRFGAIWNTGCIHCHTTRGMPRVTHDTVDTEVAEFGIACEACHGPGHEHVEANRNPVRRYTLHLTDGDDDTIVNPSHLSQERASEVCGRCHAYGAPVNPDFRFAGFRYKPGEKLAHSRRVYRGPRLQAEGRPAADRMFWEDGMVRGSGREFGGLLESPCFKGGEITCLSCHAMHKATDDPRSPEEWAEDQLRVGMRGNAACTQCHTEFAERVEEHTHHEAGSAGSNCYNCHMSYTTYGLLKAIRSHQVDSPSVQTSLDTGRPNACNQCHLDKTFEWAARHLEQWWDVPAPALDGDLRNVAASVLWLLRGDAAQRALMAWSYGWESAREASGTEWMAPYLAQLLDDPYPAVRWIAHRSLESLPGAGPLPFDFLGPERERVAARERALERWRRTTAPSLAPRPATLMDEEGLRREVFARLLAERDDRPVVVME